MTDSDIIKAYEGLTPRQQLTLFRGLHYNDGYATERGIIANAINDILPELNCQKAEIADLYDAIKCVEEINKHLSDEYIALLKYSERQNAEIARLRQKIEDYEMEFELDWERELMLMEEMTEDTP